MKLTMLDGGSKSWRMSSVENEGGSACFRREGYVSSYNEGLSTGRGQLGAINDHALSFFFTLCYRNHLIISLSISGQVFVIM